MADQVENLTEDQENDDFEKTWNARVSAMTHHFGASSDNVFHAVIPYFLGGAADIIQFEKHLPDGVIYVTSEMTGVNTGQIPNKHGQYELAMCMKSLDQQLLGLLSNLPRVTEMIKFEALETVDISQSFEGSILKALIFFHLNTTPVTFEVENQPCNVLFCMGITQEELDLKQAQGSEALLAHLKESGVFPYTDQNRASSIAPKKTWYKFW